MENLIWVKQYKINRIQDFSSAPEMESQRMESNGQIFKAMPQGMVFFLETKTFGKSLETFDSQFFFFLTCWYGLSQAFIFCIYFMLCSPPRWKRRQGGLKVPSPLLADRKKSIGQALWFKNLLARRRKTRTVTRQLTKS